MKKNSKNKVVEERGTTQITNRIVEDIVPVQDASGKITHIDIVLNDGTSFPVPNTKKNLLHFRNIMVEQAKNQKNLIANKKRKDIAYKVIAVAGAAGFVLVNITEFGKEIGQLQASVVTGAIALGNGIGIMVNNTKLSRIQRNVTFACHKDSINSSVCKNPYIYKNISAKDKQLIEKWLQEYQDGPIVIENIDKLEPATIFTIWRNINLYKDFGIDYVADGKLEEPGFQKQIEQPKKEQSK